MTATVMNPVGSRRHVPVVRGLTWVTWRQHRFAVAGVVGVLGSVSLLMLVEGVAMHHAYTRLGLNTCGRLDGATCQNPLSAFEQQYHTLADQLPHFLMLLPAGIGMFIGAPLVARELESGTFRFAWTQARSRVQWLTTKLVFLGLVLTTLTLAFSALFTWWYGPFDAIAGRMIPNGAYEISGVVFAARTLFAFTLGALLGLLIRRTVPAMAATAAVWAAIVVPASTWLRPLIRKPITTIGHPSKGVIASSHVPFNANVIHTWLQNAAGHHVSFDQVQQQVIAANRGTPPPIDQFNAWMAQHHISQWVSYQPNNWFWHYQTIEAAGYTFLAALFAVTTILILRRRAI